jgi:carboxypeptidase T
MKKRQPILWGLLLVVGLGLPLFSEPDGPVEIISILVTADARRALRGMDLDLLMERDGRIFVVAGPDDLLRLSARRIPFVIETGSFVPARPDELRLAGGINGAYHSYKELEADLKSLESAHPSIVDLQTIGTSLENRNIYAVKISDNVDRDEEEAGVLFLGCHHAREWISVEVPFLLARRLAEGYEEDPAIRELVDRSEIWIVPLLNPDGLEYSINVYRYWRKNRRANADGTFGVDLNRNYGYMWGRDNQGSSAEPGAGDYRGVSAFSEPETRAVRDLFLGGNFLAAVSYHSYSQSILYPWGFADIPTGKDDLLRGLGLEMAGLIESVNGRSYACGPAASSLYVTNGDLTDWTFGVSGIPSYTIELPPVDIQHGGFFNAEDEIESVFRENLPAMLRLVEFAIRDFGRLPAIHHQRDIVRTPLTNRDQKDKYAIRR